MDAIDVIKRIESALEHEPKVNLHRSDIAIEFADGTAILSGEVENIAAKRLALERAAALPEVSGIVDRLHVKPAEAMGDGEIASHIEHALTSDSAFDDCAVAKTVGETREVVRPRDPDRQRWWIDIRVEDGVVTLDGVVPSLSHKRLAGAMAWWVPGSRDVVNGLGVEPDERDSDAEIVDALELVLEKDPLLDASQIRATCKDAVVTLRGYARNETERDLAEFDAWAVFGVDDVVNELAAPAS
ncbi:MAG TPA: BON domain-containing protein [Gammaproteobacteria bacterium]